MAAAIVSRTFAIVTADTVNGSGNKKRYTPCENRACSRRLSLLIAAGGSSVSFLLLFVSTIGHEFDSSKSLRRWSLVGSSVTVHVRQPFFSLLSAIISTLQTGFRGLRIFGIQGMHKGEQNMLPLKVVL